MAATGGLHRPMNRSGPTIPQVYVKGEFVGGCDIVREMYQSGELQRLLEEKGVLPHGQDELREHPSKP